MADLNRIPADWVSEKDVRKATEVSHVQLLKWRRYGLLPTTPKIRRLGRGHGTETFHPPDIIPLVQRINELRKQSRSMEIWLWTLWLEGFRIDIAAWCKRRLGEIYAPLADFDQKSLEVLATRKPGRSDPRRAIYGLLNVTLWYTLMKWVAAILAKQVPIPSIYDDRSPVRVALDVVGHLTAAVPDRKSLRDLVPEPDPEFSVEGWSPDAVLAGSRGDEIEQARDDWRHLARIFAILERVELICLSGNRQALKAAYGAAVPPLIAWPLAMWRDFNARAVVFSGFIAIRRVPGYGERIDDFLPAMEREFANVLQQAGGGGAAP